MIWFDAAEIEHSTNNPISKGLLSEIDKLKSKLNEQTLKNKTWEGNSKNKPDRH